MPRQARLDAPGLLQHITARGIERRVIFHDKTDYEDFVNRLETTLIKSPNQILAWALMPNHFHLLIRSGPGGIADFMRRLMTGYAVSFNHRHRRSGHLFQNRYKSFICEEEPYLLELVRYIHLNPLRARLVQSLESLRKYPWTGHPTLMGTIKRPWQETGEILDEFSTDTSSARRKYERFLAEGRARKYRPELVGGGLIRSMGGLAETLSARREGAREMYDERVLGKGDFVEKVLKNTEKKEFVQKHVHKANTTLHSIAKNIVGATGMEENFLYQKGRQANVSRAKALLIYAGVEYFNKSSREMAALTKMSEPAASKARQRGQLIWESEGLSKLIS